MPAQIRLHDLVMGLVVEKTRILGAQKYILVFAASAQGPARPLSIVNLGKRLR